MFEPNGLGYSAYSLTPVEQVTLVEPFDVVVMSDDISTEYLALIDEDAELRPTYVAHFVSPPEYTGLLEEALS